MSQTDRVSLHMCLGIVCMHLGCIHLSWVRVVSGLVCHHDQSLHWLMTLTSEDNFNVPKVYGFRVPCVPPPFDYVLGFGISGSYITHGLACFVHA